MARLGTTATVVDAANLLTDYGSGNFLAQRDKAFGDTRMQVEMLLKQIEFANVAALGKR